MATSDCKYAGDTNAAGQIWCNKKQIYVSAKEKENCEFYQKQEILKMSAKIKRLEEILKQLEADSEVDGCALVSDRGQLMVAALHKGVDDKAVSAMAAASCSSIPPTSPISTICSVSGSR